MKKAVIYARYSSYNQTEQSIEGQVHVCEKFAEENDIEIVGSYIDRAISGTSDKRPEFQKMISDSAGGQFQSVLVYKLDRFARNRFDSALYKKKLRENGVRVISATENITDTPEGIIMEGLLEAMDEYYSAELSRKCKRGLEESFKKGRFLGMVAPFGYKVVEHKLAVDDQTAPIAVEIFERYVKGERYTDIVSDLNRRGIPNAVGNKWIRTNLSKMLSNRIYIGEYTRSTMEEVMPCPAIISKDIFDKAQESRKERAHLKRERRTDFTYYLTGKIICGNCNGRMAGQSAQKGKYHYYTCAYGGCRKTSYRADELHEAVKGALKTYLTPDKVEELALSAYEQYTCENQFPSDNEIVKSQLAKVEKQLKNGINAILNGADSIALKNAVAELEAHKQKLEERLKEVESQPPKLTYDHFYWSLKRIIEKASDTNFKRLVDTLINCVVIKDKTAVVFINLTDENKKPELEKISLKVAASSARRSLTRKNADCRILWAQAA